MNTSLARIMALLMALALGAAACGSSDGDTAAAAAPVAESETPAAQEPSILELSAPAADGSTINLSDYAGQDLMLWFWAPW